MKKILMLILCIGLMILLAGCGKDAILDTYNAAIRTMSFLELSGDSRLEGERAFAGDGFTGSYSAQYEDFTGEERILGGAFIERPEGKRVIVTCTMTAESGKAKLYWRCGTADPAILLDAPGTLVQTVELPEASSVFGVKLESFTGTVRLKIENDSNE